MKKRAKNQPNRCKDTAESRLTCKVCEYNGPRERFGPRNFETGIVVCPNCGSAIGEETGEAV